MALSPLSSFFKLYLTNFLKIHSLIYCSFIYLAALGLSRATWELQSSLWHEGIFFSYSVNDIYIFKLQHAGCFGVACKLLVVACGVLGIKPRAPALRAGTPSRWTTREAPVPCLLFFDKLLTSKQLGVGHSLPPPSSEHQTPKPKPFRMPFSPQK